MMPHTKLPDFTPYGPEEALRAAETYLLWLEFVPPPDSCREVEKLKAELRALRDKWHTLKQTRNDSIQWRGDRIAVIRYTDCLSQKMNELWYRELA